MRPKMKKPPTIGEEFNLTDADETPAMGVVVTPVGLPPLPDEPRLISVDAFTRGGNHLMQAFQTTQMLVDQGHVKRTRKEWQALLEEWMSKPR